ncbi:non-ribosomal peptide synthetase [Nonomuraea sp. B12E4]|uniref:non-ribosomal peptide synthetase n=1 Tax=Nonomuraea sp. B12E4 TaxID=3153564 RepID=UPI00325EA41D
MSENEGLGPRSPLPLQPLVHRLFEEQADRTPDAVAVVAADGELTYRELDRHANRVASLLRERGVGPDAVVGVAVERSANLVVTLLGILKAGGAYLPLDLDAPAARNAALLERAGSMLCVCRDGMDPPGALVLPGDLSGLPDHRPDVAMSADHLVSIYHTSGSTGLPKAVASTHRGWTNRMLWMQRAHRLAPGERVLQKTTLTFDDSAVEFFWPLTCGGTVVMLGPGLHRDPAAIHAAAAEHRVAVLQFVPSWLAEFLDLPPSPGLASVRLVVSAGEPLRPDLVRRFREVFGPGCELRNLWGLTEVSIDSTAHTCDAADEESGPIPIGHVIDNNDVRVLDDDLRPCPAGTVGELYIGGVGLARCYLGDPVRTAERFVADPAGTGDRLYRTGDRGYRRPDGELVFLGRHDRQVKLRGIRIELSELEEALARHPSVVNAAVVLADDRLGEPRLVAYVAGPAPAPPELTAFLAAELPAYMLPSLIVPLAEMPKTASGKTDRKALPPPDWSGLPGERAAYRAPGSPVEEALAVLWSQILDVSPVGVDDDFFALGGQSIQATRMMGRLRSGFGVELALQELYDRPTIALLAPAVTDAVHAAVAGLSDSEVDARLSGGPA